MDFDIEIWLQELTKRLFDTFNERIKFFGLQGSYKRGEANENSDVDLVVIFDKLNFEDLQRYRNVIQSMPFSEKACGFAADEKQIRNWPKYDLFQLSNDTVSLYGNLEDFIPEITKTDVEEFVKINLANLFHMLNHAFIFENKSIDVLKSAYKTAFFILQGKYYIQSSKYIPTKQELADKIQGIEKQILLTNINWESLEIGNNKNFYYETILNWIAENITS